MAPLFKIHYFPIRGRAEVLKLICAAGGADFEMVDVDYAAMKVDRALYPFGQCPSMTDVDGGVHLAQSNAIVRHLARRLDMYGGSLAEQARVDEIIEGVESIRMKYLGLVYTESLSDAAKAAFWETHLAPDGADKRNGGAHAAYLEGLLTGDFFAGNKLTVADLCAWELFDLLQRIWGLEALQGPYPKLAAHFGRVAGAAGVKEYLASPRRLEKVNNNGLG